MVETVFFWIFAFIAVAGALLTVWARNPVHSAMGLLATLFAVAVHYILNSGHLIAAVQILVYAGAIMTLFLFVIMLIGVDRTDDRAERLPLQRHVALVTSALFAAVLLAAGASAWVTGTESGPTPNGTVEPIADRIFGEWVLPFELTAILVVVAAAGTIALARFAPRRRVGAEEGEVE